MGENTTSQTKKNKEGVTWRLDRGGVIQSLRSSGLCKLRSRRHVGWKPKKSKFFERRVWNERRSRGVMECRVNIFVRQCFGLLARVPADHERDQLYPEEDKSGKGVYNVGGNLPTEIYFTK